MPEETITFELVRRIQREEQKQPKLTKLPENFFPAVTAYLQQKKSMALAERKDAFELKSAEMLVEDIYNRRERKILNHAIISARTSIPPENLSEEEKIFFNAILANVKGRREHTLKSFFNAPAAPTVTFKEDTPAFVAIDEKTYGPFKKGDVAKLPEDNMKILIERGIVEEFKVKR